VMDRLIVLDDIELNEGNPYGWSPIQIDRGKPGSSLAEWFGLPWGGPSVVVLPGYHTPTENGLKHFNHSAPGTDLFLSICGLMANGAQTILISRWRTGGQSSWDLVREFTQELADLAPSDAWQRAVLVLASSRINLDEEPRIKRGPADEPPKGTHPFFWAGYMLVDSGVPGEAGPAAVRPAQQPVVPGGQKPPAEEKPAAGEKPALGEKPVPEGKADQPQPADAAQPEAAPQPNAPKGRTTRPPRHPKAEKPKPKAKPKKELPEKSPEQER